jgi:hypothetical protein
VLDLDHYLEVLSIKPGALAGASALVHARRSGVFTDIHQRFWDLAKKKLGDRDGTRALIQVLLLHRTMTADAVVAGMERTMTTGSVDPEVVAVEGRRSLGRPVTAPVIDQALVAFDRPAPTLARYDDLLGVG